MFRSCASPTGWAGPTSPAGWASPAAEIAREEETIRKLEDALFG